MSVPRLAAFIVSHLFAYMLAIGYAFYDAGQGVALLAVLFMATSIAVLLIDNDEF